MAIKLAPKNQKPIIVFVGLDKTGKSSLAKMLSDRINFELDNFPTSKLKEVRTLSRMKTFVPDVPGAYGVETSLRTKALCHTLAHSFSYDCYRSRCKDEDFKGMIWDRFWYCAYAYNAVIGGVDLDALMHMEQFFNMPPSPDLVILVRSENPFIPLDGYDREDPQYRNRIDQEYIHILDQQFEANQLGEYLIFWNDPDKTLDENFELLFEKVKSHIGGLK